MLHQLLSVCMKMLEALRDLNRSITNMKTLLLFRFYLDVKYMSPFLRQVGGNPSLLNTLVIKL